ncbi:hypothetical protein FRC12_015828 [Ceratobasidium sp. 428]|nr:hypothetical protein FRC12_015828 [Ceratobasidium sp. 428]
MPQSPMPDHTAPPHRALDTPELLHKILSYLPVSDVARLCRVSRLFFFRSSPEVWKHLENIMKLFKLIPGAKFTPVPPLRLPSDTITINVPKAPDLTRLNHYGLLVHSLKPFRRNTIILIQDSDGWKELEMQKATRPNGFLPNLSSLDVLNTCHYQSASDWCRLLLLLICPKLEHARLSYDITPNKTWDDPIRFKHLTFTMFKCCPKLRTLHLLLGNELNSSYGFREWSRLQDLEHLETDLDIINDFDALLVIVRLPKLTHLGLRYQREYQVPKETLTLPARMFPALTTLDVECTHPAFAEYIWSILPLVGITRARVKVEYSPVLDVPSSWTDSVVRAVCTRGPNLRDLELDIYDPGRCSRHYSIAHALLSALKALPLKSIKLVHARIHPRVNTADFASLFPAMQDLQIPSQGVKFVDLYQIAIHLLHLRRLSVALRNSHIPPAVKAGTPASYIPITVAIESMDFLCSKSGKFLKQTAT